MRIFMKAVTSTVTVGLLAFGAVVGTGGPAFAALDDFTLAMPSLEDVYLALGGSGEGLVKV